MTSLKIFGCPNRGCQQMIHSNDVYAHSTECLHRSVACLNCQNLVDVENINDHNMECSHRPIMCLDCGNNVAFCDLSVHNSSCPKKIIACKLSALGLCLNPDCTGSFYRAESTKHLLDQSTVLEFANQLASMIHTKVENGEIVIEKVVKRPRDVVEKESTVAVCIADERNVKRNKVLRHCGDMKLTHVVSSNLIDKVVCYNLDIKDDASQNTLVGALPQLATTDIKQGHDNSLTIPLSSEPSLHTDEVTAQCVQKVDSSTIGEKLSTAVSASKDVDGGSQFNDPPPVVTSASNSFQSKSNTPVKPPVPRAFSAIPVRKEYTLQTAAPVLEAGRMSDNTALTGPSRQSQGRGLGFTRPAWMNPYGNGNESNTMQSVPPPPQQHQQQRSQAHAPQSQYVNN